MINLCAKNSKVVFDSSLLLLYFFLDAIDVLFLISKEEDQIFGEDVRLIYKIAEL